MVFEHGLTKACLYKDVPISASHVFAGGPKEWWGTCHLPSKSACGPHEDLRHRKCATPLCLHRPQAAVVQRSSGQNNGAVSTYHHTLKTVKKKKDWNWIQECLVTQSLYVLSGPAMAMQHPSPPFFTSIKCKDRLKVLLLPSRQGSALEEIWCSFKLYFELHQKFTVFYVSVLSLLHCHSLKGSLKHKWQEWHSVPHKPSSWSICAAENPDKHAGIATNYHYYKKRQGTYTKCSLPLFQSSFQFFLRGTSIAIMTKIRSQSKDNSELGKTNLPRSRDIASMGVSMHDRHMTNSSCCLFNGKLYLITFNTLKVGH